MYRFDLIKKSFQGTFHHKDSPIVKNGAFWINQNNEIICSPDGKEGKNSSIIHTDPWKLTPQYSLSVFGNLGDLTNNPIYGDLENGKKITLFDASIATQFIMNKSDKTSILPFKKSFSTYYVNFALLGNKNIPVFPDKLHTIYVTYSTLHEISDHLFSKQDNSKQSQHKFISTNNFSILLMRNNHQSSISFNSKEPQQIIWFFEKIDSFRNYLTCITGLPTYIENVFLNIGNDVYLLLSEFDRKYNYNYLGNFWEINWRSYINLEIFENTVKHWFKFQHNETYIDNFISSVSCNVPVLMHYFSLISALESLHKKKNPISNTMSIQDRLTSIIDSLSSLIPKLAGLMKENLDIYANTRNFIGHANQITGQKTFDLSSYPSAIFALHILMQLSILKEMCIDDLCLLSLINTTASYVNIR